MKRKLAVALVHYPIVDAQGDIVTTAVTNLDIHDIARSARTFGCSDYFIVHPIEAQRALVNRICEHWTTGSGARRIPDRKRALELVRIVSTLEEAIDRFGEGGPVETWVTAARDVATPISFEQAREVLSQSGPPVLLIFGTGWGLAKSVIESATAALPPIRIVGSDFNHLSVRAAAAIMLDRLITP